MSMSVRACAIWESITYNVRLTLCLCTVVMLGAVSVVTAQTPAAPAPAPLAASTEVFDAASIKVNNYGNGGFVMPLPSHGYFTATNVTLLHLISSLYRTQPAQVLNGPDWLTSMRFDIEARGRETATVPEVYAMA